LSFSLYLVIFIYRAGDPSGSQGKGKGRCLRYAYNLFI